MRPGTEIDLRKKALLHEAKRMSGAKSTWAAEVHERDEEVRQLAERIGREAAEEGKKGPAPPQRT